MTERGILFSGAMVRALLDGTKTQTRRPCKPMNEWVNQECREVRMVDGQAHHFLKGARTSLEVLRCPYGQPGDRLWVRETFFAYGRWEKRYSAKKARDEWHFVDMTVECDRAYQYAASNPEVPLATGRGPLPGWYTRPAIFMPRAASRIALEVVSVPVERLQVIGDRDAIAEGIERVGNNYGNGPAYCDYGMTNQDDTAEWFNSPVDSYQSLWESINGAGSWDANPWVWVVEFKRVQS